MISIIGGGPVGSYQAYCLAKKGHKVHVYEGKEKIGIPVQCTGILTHSLKDYINIKKSFLQNTINKAKIIAPNGDDTTIKFKQEDYLVCRTKFDQHIADLAEQEGAKIFLKHRYKGNEGTKIKVGDKVVPTKALIGADGPHSAVAKAHNMLKDRKFVIGHQVTVELEVDDPHLMEIWVGLGMFSWCVPEGNGICRVGIVSYDKPVEYLNKLLKMRCPKAKIIGKQTGHIPLYNPKQILQKNNVYLIGDAATHVKATSFGGIIPGMKAATILARDMNNYQQTCKKEVGKDLYLSLMIRKILDRFSEKDYNDLIKKFQNEKLIKILEANSRDFPTKFALQLFLAKPSLLKFAKHLIF